jgi:signal transduction histidine kinase
VLKVNDNGVGFNPDNELSGKTASLSGNGLRNMHTRTAELKGKLEIISQPGKKTAITLQFPIA